MSSEIARQTRIVLIGQIIDLKSRIPFTNLQGPAVMGVLLTFAHRTARMMNVAISPENALEMVREEAPALVREWLDGVPPRSLTDEEVRDFAVHISAHIPFHLAVGSPAFSLEAARPFSSVSTVAGWVREETVLDEPS